jgi:hypothetical protein
LANIWVSLTVPEWVSGEEAVALDPSGESHYNLACALARAGRSDEARRLEEAVRRNPKLLKHAAQDSDLEALRGTAGYKKLVGQ